MVNIQALSKGVGQFVLIYLFTFMTAFDAQKMAGSKMQSVLDHPVSHFVVIFGIYYSMNGGNIGVSLAVAAVVTLAFLALNVIEFMDSRLRLMEDSPSIHPDARSVTAKQVFSMFNEDIAQMRQAFTEIGIPADSVLNDLTAPKIATYLIYAGYEVNKKPEGLVPLSN